MPSSLATVSVAFSKTIRLQRKDIKLVEHAHKEQMRSVTQERILTLPSGFFAPSLETIPTNKSPLTDDTTPPASPTAERRHHQELAMHNLQPMDNGQEFIADESPSPTPIRQRLGLETVRTQNKERIAQRQEELRASPAEENTDRRAEPSPILRESESPVRLPPERATYLVSTAQVSAAKRSTCRRGPQRAAICLPL